MFRDGGTTIWGLAENPMNYDVVVNPSPAKAKRGKQAEAYSDCSKEDFEIDVSGVGQWYLIKQRLESGKEPDNSGISHVSNGEKLF